MRSLLVKISLLTCALMVAAIAVFSAVFIGFEQSYLRENVELSSRSFAIYATPVIYREYLELYTHPLPPDAFWTAMRSILEDNSDVKQMRLVAINGKILFDSDEIASGKYAGPDRFLDDEIVMEAVRGTQVRTLRLERHTATGADFLIVVPVEDFDTHVISAVYEVSYDSLVGRSQQFYRRVIVTALLLLAFALLFPIPFLYAMIRPLRNLKEASRKIGSGHFDVKVVPVSNDEIGELAQAFNQMQSELKESHDRLRRSNTDLERRVEERTGQLQEKVDEMKRLQDALVGRELRMVELKAENDKLREVGKNGKNGKKA